MNYVTPNEIKLIIKKLPIKRASGHGCVFKKLPAKGLLFMPALLNSLLTFVTFHLNGK